MWKRLKQNQPQLLHPSGKLSHVRTLTVQLLKRCCQKQTSPLLCGLFRRSEFDIIACSFLCGSDLCSQAIHLAGTDGRHSSVFQQQRLQRSVVHSASQHSLICVQPDSLWEFTWDQIILRLNDCCSCTGSLSVFFFFYHCLGNVWGGVVSFVTHLVPQVFWSGDHGCAKHDWRAFLVLQLSNPQICWSIVQHHYQRLVVQD